MAGCLSRCKFLCHGLLSYHILLLSAALLLPAVPTAPLMPMLLAACRTMSTNLDAPIHWRGQALPVSQPSTLGPRLHAAQPGVHF